MLGEQQTGVCADGTGLQIAIRISKRTASVEALLKTCYWYSRTMLCEVKDGDIHSSLVLLTPKKPSQQSAQELREEFIARAMDFALREVIENRTSSVRDMLLAKAFAEAGVLEDVPEGVFGDEIEEAKPDGMFKILSNH